MASQEPDRFGELLCSYLGLGFAVFLGLLPGESFSLISTLQTRNESLSLKLAEAEQQLRQLHSRRIEDSKANARVVEIFASHRHAWQQEEKRLLQQIDERSEEAAFLKGKVEELERVEAELRARINDFKREIGDKDEMLKFMCRSGWEEDGGAEGECYSEMGGNGVEEIGSVFGERQSSASKFWLEKASLWQDMQSESVGTQYNMKHFVSRRESPWKADGESNGVASKLKVLEQELLNLEGICKGGLSRFPSQLRKQAKRYQALSCKIEDLCHRMQDPSEEAGLSSEMRTQRHTEFLLEAFRLQQNASETGQKLMALQTEMGRSNSCAGDDELEGPAARRSLVSIRNNLKEIQRNLEIWLARIIGDVEGTLARDGGASYYASRYPFAQ